MTNQEFTLTGVDVSPDVFDNPCGLPKAINRTTKTHREEMEDLVQVYSLMNRENLSVRTALPAVCLTSNMQTKSSFTTTNQRLDGDSKYAG